MNHFAIRKEISLYETNKCCRALNVISYYEILISHRKKLDGLKQTITKVNLFFGAKPKHHPHPHKSSHRDAR